jgi:hypothetical protein
VSEWPEVVKHCATILVELSYWTKLDVSEELGDRLAERCVYYFSWGPEKLNGSVVTLIANLCVDYEPFSNLIISKDVFIEIIQCFLSDVKELSQFVTEMAAMSYAIVLNPIDEEYTGQILSFIQMLLTYRYVSSRVYGLMMIQTLLQHGIELTFAPEIVEIFVGFSGGEPRVLTELMRTLRVVKDEELLESILSRDFLNNLAIQIHKNPDDTGAEIIKFLRSVVHITHPDINDLTIVLTITAFHDAAFRFLHQGVKFFRDLCREDKEFTLALGGSGICAWAMPVLIDHAEEKVASYVFDIFLWPGTYPALTWQQCPDTRTQARSSRKSTSMQSSTTKRERSWSKLGPTTASRSHDELRAFLDDSGISSTFALKSCWVYRCCSIANSLLQITADSV